MKGRKKERNEKSWKQRKEGRKETDREERTWKYKKI
jgi:hypothetical protein